MLGKYQVTRTEDGSAPEWPYFVFGARDPAAPTALRAYADEAERLGYVPEYVDAIRDHADLFEEYRTRHGDGDVSGANARRG